MLRDFPGFRKHILKYFGRKRYGVSNLFQRGSGENVCVCTGTHTHTVRERGKENQGGIIVALGNVSEGHSEQCSALQQLFFISKVYQNKHFLKIKEKNRIQKPPHELHISFLSRVGKRVTAGALPQRTHLCPGARLCRCR